MSNKKRGSWLVYIVLVIFLLSIPLFNQSNYTLHVCIMIGINIILASSLRLIKTIGLLSLGHGGMMAVGAYTSALLVMKLNISFWFALPLAGLAAFLLALIVGFQFVRLKGFYFVMITLFLTEVIRLVAEKWRSLTGGTNGIMGIPRPDLITLPGILSIDFGSKTDYYYFILFIVIITLVIFYGIDSSRIGMIFQTIEQDNSLAESIGINTANFKVFAFSVGSFFAGISGACLSHYLTAIVPETFGFLLVIYIIIFMVVGGDKRFSGPILGAIVMTLVPEFARVLKQFEPFVFAGVLILTIFFLPEGLVSLPHRLRKIIAQKR